LITELASTVCLAEPVAPSAWRVVQPVPSDAEQARLELGFFLRGWQHRHPGVEVTISY